LWGLILHASVCSMNSSWLWGLAWAEALQSQCSPIPCLNLQVWSSFLLLDLAFYTNTEALMICKAKLEPEVIQSGDLQQLARFTEMFQSSDFCEIVKDLKDRNYQTLAKGRLTPRPNIRGMINTLKSEGWKIAVIHNSTAIRDFDLNQLHLLNLPSAVVNSGCLVKETRPYAGLYVEALSRLDLTPDTCVCLATHPFQVLDAATIGLTSLLITDSFNANLDFACPYYRVPPPVTQPASGDLVAAIRSLNTQRATPATELEVGMSCLALDSTELMLSLGVILDISPAENGESRQVEVKFLSSGRTSLIPLHNVVLLKSEIQLLQ